MVFKNETLDALTDEQVQSAVSYGQTLLKTRQEKREDDALETAATAMRAAGLTVNMKALRAMAKKAATVNGSAKYKAGTHYQHPDDAGVVWSGKGQKPNWIRDLEAAGKRPVEAAA
jgi:DNA-binding protein H-NS